MKFIGNGYMSIDCFTVKNYFIFVKIEIIGNIIKKKAEVAHTYTVKLFCFTGKLSEIGFR